jgi:hypothetical protein
MTMLEFIRPTGVFLDHVQPRVELHGGDHVHAIDLSITYTGGNKVLDDVAPGLRAALFTAHTRQPTGKPQSEMDLPVDDMPHLRAPALVSPLRLDCETEGATVVVANGIKASTSIRLTECRIHKLRLTAIEGGSTEVKFSVSSASGIDAQIVGALSMKQQQEIELTLVGPKVDGQGARPDGQDVEVLWPFPGKGPAPDDNKPAPVVTTKKRRKIEKDAGEVFAEQHGRAPA